MIEERVATTAKKLSGRDSSKRSRLGLPQGAGTRKGFTSEGDVICENCFDAKLKLDDLREEIVRLKKKIKRLENSEIQQARDTTHRPSSRVDFKKDTDPESQKKRGGGKVGHPGRSRTALHSRDAKRNAIIELPRMEKCPDCDVNLKVRDLRERTVVDVAKQKAKRLVFKFQRTRCPQCARIYAPRPPVLPKALYSNRLVAQAAVMHYVHAVSIGTICRILGPEVKESSLIATFQRLGKMCEKAAENFRIEYRKSYVKHADETGWRTDGKSGYAWLFTSPTVSIFTFRETRAAHVAHEVFGPDMLAGVLVVDRYGGYNKAPCAIQYCYAHLLREVAKIGEEFSQDEEVSLFAARLAPLLAQAMRLRTTKIPDIDFYREAAVIKNEILAVFDVPCRHTETQRIYSIFNRRKKRLYHWADDRRVPAENNFAEREIRSAVIARKTSFGSQSEAGAKARSHIMSVLFTAQKRLGGQPVEEWLHQSLNTIAADSSQTLLDVMPLPSHPNILTDT